jgi:hypothetical protein
VTVYLSMILLNLSYFTEVSQTNLKPFSGSFLSQSHWHSFFFFYLKKFSIILKKNSDEIFKNFQRLLSTHFFAPFQILSLGFYCKTFYSCNLGVRLGANH